MVVNSFGRYLYNYFTTLLPPPQVLFPPPKTLESLDGEDQYPVIIRLLIQTGFRRGEACGLEWSGIDFDNNVLTVRRSPLYLPGRGVFSDVTKNATSNRSIKTAQTVIDMLLTKPQPSYTIAGILLACHDKLVQRIKGHEGSLRSQ